MHVSEIEAEAVKDTVMLQFKSKLHGQDFFQACGKNGIYLVAKNPNGKWRVEYDAFKAHSGRFKPFPQKLTFDSQVEAMALCSLYERSRIRK
jgi:hypothetical protein